MKSLIYICVCLLCMSFHLQAQEETCCIFTYRTLNGRVVEPQREDAFLDAYEESVPILSNVYENGIGKMALGGYPVEIADSSFINCNLLTSIDIPVGFLCIGSYAFANCENLSNISIPSSVYCMGQYVFDNTQWYERQPDGMVYAGLVAYNYKGVMPAGTSITIRDGTKGIAAAAFRNRTELTNVVLPESLTSIRGLAFEGTSLIDIELPQNLRYLGNWIFHECYSLKHVILPDNLTCIPEGTFSKCYDLESIVLPAYVDSLYSYAFHKCFALKSIYVGKIPPRVASVYTFKHIVKDSVTVYVPIGSKSLYQEADYWKEFANIEEYGDPQVLAENLTIEPSSLAMKEGEIMTLEVSIEPDSATEKSVSFWSDNMYVATISNQGVITALHAGNCHICVQTNDGSALTAECEVTVESSAGIKELEYDDEQKNGYRLDGIRIMRGFQGFYLLPKTGRIRYPR